MKIKILEIKKFRKVENIKINLDDKLHIFEGKNGIGKTTIIDSILWVLSDETIVYGKQDSDNRDFNDLKSEINVILTCDDGTILERKYWDVWKENILGESTYVKTENKFFINGTPYKKTEYFDEIKNMLNLDRNIKLPKDFNIIRAIIDYNYFWSIDYKISRAFLETVLKLKTDIEMLNDEKYHPIKLDVMNTKFDLSKAMINIKNEYSLLEKQISDCQVILNDLKLQYSDEKVNDLKSLYEKRDKLNGDKIENNADFKAIIERLEEIDKLIKEEEKVSNKAFNSTLEKINNLSDEEKELREQLNIVKIQAESYNEDIAYRMSRIDTANESIYILNSIVDDETLCPNCGYILNQKTIDNNKIEREKRIKDLKNEIEIVEKELEILKGRKENTQTEIDKIQNKISDNEAEQEILHIELSRKENSKIETLKEEKDNKLAILEELREKFDFEKNLALTLVMSEIGNLSYLLNIPERMKQITESIKNYEMLKLDLEVRKELIREFKKEKLETIKQKTSKVFPSLEIEIIEENENTGNLKEVCYAKLKNVEYKGINDGNKKIIGIITIEELKKALNLTDFPIIFDKAGDLDSTNLNQILNITNSQVLATRVNDKENF